MSTLNASVVSLLDHAKRLDPDGSIAPIVELLAQRNPALNDIPFKEGNLPTGHRFTVRNGLPALSWRKFNEGVDATKSHTTQFDETCGMLSGRSEVDCELAKLNGNEAAFRMSEEAGFLQALYNEVETGIFYHSTKSNPEKFMGLSPRFDSLSGLTGNQVINGDATASGADQASIWLVKWGEGGAYGIFPKGSVAGFVRTDMGMQLVTDANSKKYRAYVTTWDWKLGMVVEDYRSVVRICNLDATNLSLTGSVLQQKMIQAYHKVFQPGAGKLRWYMNRSLCTYLHAQAVAGVANSTLTVKEYGGQPLTHFLGIPIIETDGLVSTESVVS